MKYAFFSVIFICLSFTSSAQIIDFFKWEYTKLDVKKHHEKSVLLEETMKNQLDELHFVQFDSGYAHHFVYLFKKDILEGIRTHRVSLSGSNSKMDALDRYDKLHDKYVNKYGTEKVKIKNGPEQAVKISELHLTETDIFITIEKNGGEYYLVENFFRKGLKAKM